MAAFGGEKKEVERLVNWGTSLESQWLKLRASNAGAVHSIYPWSGNWDPPWLAAKPKNKIKGEWEMKEKKKLVNWNVWHFLGVCWFAHYPESSPVWYKVADSPCSGTQRELLFKKSLSKIMRLVKRIQKTPKPLASCFWRWCSWWFLKSHSSLDTYIKLWWCVCTHPPHTSCQLKPLSSAIKEKLTRFKMQFCTFLLNSILFNVFS